MALLASRVSAELGLHFPREHWHELQCGLAAAARELGVTDAQAGAELLAGAPWTEAQVRTLAGHLTIGETYFFRDLPLLQAFEREILPELLSSARASRSRQLRLWSAGCCTGEEPYSLAILLEEALPDLAAWDADILATDVNPRALAKARAACYGEWSFRGVPADMRRRAFDRAPRGLLQVRPQARALVRFAELNLARESYPSAANRTTDIDVIFCRNVLMYFSREQAHRAVLRLRGALRGGGWLIVSGSEACHVSCPGLEPVRLGSAIAFRKQADRPTDLMHWSASLPQPAACGAWS